MVKSKVRKLASKSNAQNLTPPLKGPLDKPSHNDPGEKPTSPSHESSGAPAPAEQALLTNGRSALNGSVVAANGTNGGDADLGKSETPDKIKQLVRLAQEQGYLTYNDINEILPHNVTSAGGARGDPDPTAQSRGGYC